MRAPILDEANLGPAILADIAARLPDAGSLGDVVRWALHLALPRLVSDVIVQDEFTHDVVIPLEDNIVLVFDTT